MLSSFRRIEQALASGFFQLTQEGCLIQDGMCMHSITCRNSLQLRWWYPSPAPGDVLHPDRGANGKNGGERRTAQPAVQPDPGLLAAQAAEAESNLAFAQPSDR